MTPPYLGTHRQELIVPDRFGVVAEISGQIPTERSMTLQILDVDSNPRFANTYSLQGQVNGKDRHLKDDLLMLGFSADEITWICNFAKVVSAADQNSIDYGVLRIDQP